MSDAQTTDGCILKVKGVTLPDQTTVSFTAGRGEAFCVTSPCSELFDILSGVELPADGIVLFSGKDWTDLDPFSECLLRAEIGRTFPQDRAWVENLSLRLNIGLRVLHSGILSQSEADTSVDALAELFEVSPFLDRRPEGVSVSVLTRCQWVRALLGKPRLLLLEDPETGVTREQSQLLLTCLTEYVSEGGTLLWGDSAGSRDAGDFGVKAIKHISDADTVRVEE